MPSPVPLSRRKFLPSRRLIKAGKIALLLWLTLIVIALVSYWLGWVLILQLPLRPLGVFLAMSGLICWVSGWLCGRPPKKQIAGVVCIVLMGFNILAFAGAYALTHSPMPGQWGLGRSKPQNARQPTDFGLTYTSQRIRINEAEWIETWLISAPQPQGTVLLFPGNHGTKGGQLLPPAHVFHDLGYSCLLADFRGAGGSSGYKTSVGFWEAEDVALV
ncbi:MAG: alpha/beta hydrolase, partial [Cyanobacteria bacterium P01_A01_bin.17]